MLLKQEWMNSFTQMKNKDADKKRTDLQKA